MNESTLISVVLPTYKRAEKIKNTLEMLKLQSFNYFEVIVIDDNGLGEKQQIDTQEVIAAYQKELNIHYHALKVNSGAPHARNVGASLAKGKYLSFLDDDDTWAPSKLKVQYDALKINDANFVYCTQVYINKNQESTYNAIPFFKNIKKNLITNNCIGGCSNPLIERSLFHKVSGFDTSLDSCQDWDLWYKIAQFTTPLFIDQKLIFVDRNDFIRISTNKRKVLIGHLKFYDKIANNINGLPKFLLQLKIIRLFIKFLFLK